MYKRQLLHRPGGDKLVNLHAVLLPDSMGPVGGLILGGNVPPGIVMDHYVRSGEVQAGPPGLEGNQKHLRGVPVEAVHHGGPLLLRGGTLKQIIPQPLRLQPAADELQHRGELGEKQHLVPRRRGLGQQLHAALQLGAPPLIVLVAQGRVATDLPQPGQHGENRQLVASQRSPLLPQPLPGLHGVGGVEPVSYTHLQESKRELADAVVREGEGLLASMTADQLLEILE